MKKAHILHNPNAGKGEYTKKELIAIVEAQGYECGYSSTKEKGWREITDDIDFLILAGGDGTVRKVVVKLIDKDGKNHPIALLPLGTANNISKALGINGHAKEIITHLDKDRRKKFDTGRIKGLKEGSLFIESFGYGVFPELMKLMKEKPVEESVMPEEEIKEAQRRVHDIILNYQAEDFIVTIDGMEHKGKYLLVEVMNISSIGPNMGLSPHSDPGDGEFEVVLIPEGERDEFASYISHKISGEEKSYIPLIVKGSEITIETPSGLLHIDDELIETEKQGRVTIKPKPGMVEFLVQ